MRWRRRQQSEEQMTLDAKQRAAARGRRHLENVIAGFEIADVDPLAVDVVSVQIPAAHGDALIAEVGALVAFRNT